MGSLYDVDRAEETGEDRAARHTPGPPHAFVFDRQTRRFVCEKCGGVMNECPARCTMLKVHG